MFLQSDTEENSATLKAEEKKVDDQISSLEVRSNALLCIGRYSWQSIECSLVFVCICRRGRTT